MIGWESKSWWLIFAVDTARRPQGRTSSKKCDSQLRVSLCCLPMGIIEKFIIRILLFLYYVVYPKDLPLLPSGACNNVAAGFLMAIL
jgi:hypothetical protein